MKWAWLIFVPMFAFAQRGQETTTLPTPAVKGQAGKYLRLATTERALEWATIGGFIDSTRASYWATALRGAVDSARASYWSTRLRGDTTTSAYWATALRGAVDTTRAAYWSTRLRGDTTTSAYLATGLRVAPDTTRASYWASAVRGAFIDTSRASYWSTKLRGDTTTASYWSSNVRGNYLKPADSTTLKNALLKNADSTTLKNALLKNADSTTMKNSLLKNADSTTLKNALLKNADSTTIRNYDNALYAPKASPTFTGRWTGSASIKGTATFTTTGVRVAVYVPGTAAGDIVVCTPTLATVVTTTNLTAFAKTDSLIFLRGASGTSGAVLNWILIR